jgi:WD40 repeat protein
MSKIFVSYAREDVDIAERIVDALAKNKFDTWIDWKSIPKGEKFEEEIYQGIENAEIFLFLLSPSSAQSEWCDKEIAYAVKNGKRIIPIFVGDKDVETVKNEFLTEEQKKEITGRNLIFCRDGYDEFDKAINQTLETIHADYEWVKYHTLLLVKAHDWERAHSDKGKDNDKALLLRGSALSDAEDKLATIERGEAPYPTKLQRNYLLQSRRHEYLQRRRTTISLGLVLFTVVLLAFVAWTQRNSAIESEAVAQEEKNRAEEQTEISLARSLTDKSNSLGLPEAQLFTYGDNRQVAGNYTVSVLLAIESIKRVPTSEGVQALLSKIKYLPNVIAELDDSKTFKPYSQTIYYADGYFGWRDFYDIQISEQRGLFAKIRGISKGEYEVSIWDMYNWQKKSTVNITALPIEYPIVYSYPPVIMSLPANLVFYIAEDSLFAQYLTDAEGKKRLWVQDSPVVDFRCFSDRFLGVATQNGTIKLWDILSLEEVLTIQTDLTITSLDLSKTSEQLFIEAFNEVEDSYSFLVFDIYSNEFSFEHSPAFYKAQDESGRVVALNTDDDLQIRDTVTNELVLVLEDEHFLQFVPNSTKILSVAKLNGKYILHIWDYKNKTQQISYNLEISFVSFVSAFSYSGEKLAFTNENSVYIYNVMEDKLQKIDTGYRVDTLVFNHNGSKLATANRLETQVTPVVHSYNATIWDLESGNKINVLPHDNHIESMIFIPASDGLITADIDGALYVWNPDNLRRNNNTIIDYAYAGRAPVGSVNSSRSFAVPLFSPDGKELAVGGSLGLHILDVASQQNIVPDNWNLSYEMEYSPDGEWLAFTGLTCQVSPCPNNIKIWNNETNSYHLIDPVPDDDNEAQIEFSPNSQYLAVNWNNRNPANEKDVLRIWDTNLWQMLKEVDLGSFVSSYISFSPTGDLLIMRRIDEERGMLAVVEIPGMEEKFSTEFTFSKSQKNTWDAFDETIAFDADGSILAFGLGKEIHVWDINSGKETVLTPSDKDVSGIVFNPIDGTGISIHKDIIYFWDKSGRVFSESIAVAASSISNPLITSDGSFLLLQATTEVLIIDLGIGLEVDRINMDEPIYSVNLSQDDEYIAVGSDFGSVRVFVWKPDNLINDACSRITRNLTFAEWDEYVGNHVPYEATCPNLPVPEE